MRLDYPKFQAAGAEILVIGPESAKSFQDYWQKHDLTFPGLPDPKHRVLKMFGQEISLFKLGRMPAQVVIDRRGIARYVHYGQSMSDIPEDEELLAVLRRLEQTPDDPAESGYPVQSDRKHPHPHPKLRAA